MRSKLTLTIDDEVIEKAKSYAKRKRRSVSKIVEEYLLMVASPRSIREAMSSEGFGPLTSGIFGMFEQDYRGQEYDELLESALAERHT